ncbi:hypothetical protein VIN01S_24430 [Vibrio inusitatus NBRC 102082]|uniref:Uncharacterized protein n=1 Tax=Vibrio inusitatus NBRC 102082 TaxID=1219070 RepID=A0A4Y3HWT1_9VIBR|nr:hypothetical protein VIN01S_24430 [Vibrio inusitatus NBRC 102082]
MDKATCDFNVNSNRIEVTMGCVPLAGVANPVKLTPVSSITDIGPAFLVRSSNGERFIK